VKKDDDVWIKAPTIDEDKKPYEKAGRKKVDSSAEMAVS
jgi:hypothetical protein